MCTSYSFLPRRIRLPELLLAAFTGIALEMNTNSWHFLDTGVRADAGPTPEEAGRAPSGLAGNLGGSWSLLAASSPNH